MSVKAQEAQGSPDTDRIEKRLELRASRSRVWRAIATAEELWHPNAVDTQVDYSAEPTTLVEFILEETESGTAVTIIESGFDRIPLGRRDEAFRRNERGWAGPLKNLEQYVS